MNIRIDEDPFAKIAHGITKIYHEVSILLKFLQTKPLVKNMNNNYGEVYYTVIKNRDEKEIVDYQYENDYMKFYDIVPYHYTGRQNNNDKLWYGNMRSVLHDYEYR